MIQTDLVITVNVSVCEAVDRATRVFICRTTETFYSTDSVSDFFISDRISIQCGHVNYFRSMSVFSSLDGVNEKIRAGVSDPSQDFVNRVGSSWRGEF